MALTKVTYSMIEGASANVKDFGAVGDGVTDDTAAIQAALDSGLPVYISSSMRCYVASDINIPNGGKIYGDSTAWPATGTLALTTGSAIILNSSATIKVNQKGALEGIYIIRQGLTAGLTSATITSTFLGTAVTLQSNARDVFIQNCTILGFYTAIKNSDGDVCTRFRIEDVFMDCRNGIRLSGSGDVARIINAHCWPLMAQGVYDSWLNVACGITAFHIKGANDWTKLVNCFCYGYTTGYLIENSSNVSLSGCGADYNVPNPIGVQVLYPTRTATPNGSVGIKITGTSSEPKIINCQVAAVDTGVVIDNTSSYNTVQIVGQNVWGTLVAGIEVINGDLMLTNYIVRSAYGYGYGVRTKNTAGKVTIAGAVFENTEYGIYQDVNTTKLLFSNCIYNSVDPLNKVVNPFVPTIASADPLVLDGEYNVFNVSGTTNFGNVLVEADYAGKIVVLKFLGVLTVTDGGPRLKLVGNFTTAAGSTLTLVSDGTVMTELARSTP